MKYLSHYNRDFIHNHKSFVHNGKIYSLPQNHNKSKEIIEVRRSKNLVFGDQRVYATVMTRHVGWDHHKCTTNEIVFENMDELMSRFNLKGDTLG